MAVRLYIASLRMAEPATRSQKRENHLGSHDKGIDDVSNAVFRSYN